MNHYIFVLAAIFSVACAAKLDWRIDDGIIAKDGQFPYQVSIQQLNYHFCGGSILNEQWVLTAAHCVYRSSIRFMTVVTGSNKLDQGGDVYQVARTIIHKDFGYFKLENDIALVKINGSIAFNAKVQPIPLETSDIAAGANLILSSWGTTSFPGNILNDLHFMPLKAISSEDCNSRHVDSGLSVSSNQLCTLTKSGEGVCNCDSGSPLAHDGKVAGIVSWGQGCVARYPDVFTRVSSFVEWIHENMED